MTIDWTINITGLIAILTTVIGGVIFMVTVQKDVGQLKAWQEHTVTTLESLAKGFSAIALTDERLTNLSRRLEDEKMSNERWLHWARSELSKQDAEINQVWSVIAKKPD